MENFFIRFVKKPLFKRVARFCIVGCSGVLVDMTVLYFLADPKTLGWSVTLSKIIAAECAILNNFLWNDSWTFSDYCVRQKDITTKTVRFLKFNLVCSAGLIISVMLLHFLTRPGGLNLYAANFIAIIAVTSWNFGMNYRFNWKTDADLVARNSARKEKQKKGGSNFQF